VLRSTAYFHGYGLGDHLAVLVLWALLGLAAIVLGHHGSPKFAAYRSRMLERVESA
jgi:hypothetical protein